MNFSDTNDSAQQVRAATAAIVTSLLCVAVTFVFGGRYGLNLWDEGYLWYGVQRVWLGEVPIRDFMAYDPGRYYWTALLSTLWGGRGILDIRLAAAIMQWLGLAAGLWIIALRLGSRGIGFVVIAAVILLAWMFPRHKLYDIAVSIMLVALLSWWFRHPDPRRYFVLGVGIGLAACIGRNHGVYALVGSVLAFCIIAFDKKCLLPPKLLLMWVLGIVTGFLPVVLACIVIPGFASAFWSSIAYLFELRATNLPLPIPWPWRVPFASLGPEQAVRGFLQGFAFVGLLAFPLLGLARLIRRRINGYPIEPAFTAAVCLAVPYAHYALSRADVAHLAQGIFPALIGTLLILAGSRSVIRWIGSAVLLVATIWVAAPSHPRIACERLGRCENVLVSGQRLVVEPAVAADIALLRNLAARYAPNDRAFVATPFWPGAYALLGRRSPMWEIYALQHRSVSFQNEEIRRLRAANPGFVIVLDIALDNRQALRYENTHPLIADYIASHFVRVPSRRATYQIYRAADTYPSHVR